MWKRLILERLPSEQETAIIVITHDNKIFDRLDRIARLRNDPLESQEK